MRTLVKNPPDVGGFVIFQENYPYASVGSAESADTYGVGEN